MKKIIIILFALFLSFININKLSAIDKVIKTQTDNKIIFVQDHNGAFSYSWSFDKNEYNRSDYEFDLGIKFKSPNELKINNLINKNIKKEYISFNYHGKLPGVATIKVPVKKFNDNQKLYLYYYNSKTNKIEFVRNNIRVSNGYVTFNISHCSDYFLTLSVVEEATGNNNNGIIIMGMLIVIVGLVGFIMFKNKE